MTSNTTPLSSGGFPGVTIPFRDRYTVSPQFQALFAEGMALVEETANYLDGPGRSDAIELKPTAKIAYATESMRLTTRLMQLASWLLVRRAVNRGELTPADAASEKHRVTLVPIGRSTQTKGYDELPRRLRELVEASLKLHDRVIRLDRVISEDVSTDGNSGLHPVGAHIDRIRSAFAQGGR